MQLEKYKDIFGKAKTGIHSVRILDTPIVDYFGSILIAMLISYGTGLALSLSTIAILVLGIFAHKLFGVDTITVRQVL
jgi:hypothetical protein